MRTSHSRQWPSRLPPRSPCRGCSDAGRAAGRLDGGSRRASGQDATIGVALPHKTSENWVLAEEPVQRRPEGRPASSPTSSTPTVGVVATSRTRSRRWSPSGAKVIIIGAIDGGQLATQVKAAKDAGATVIAYDRLILNTTTSTTTSRTTT